MCICVHISHEYWRCIYMYPLCTFVMCASTFHDANIDIRHKQSWLLVLPSLLFGVWALLLPYVLHTPGFLASGNLETILTPAPSWLGSVWLQICASGSSLVWVLENQTQGPHVYDICFNIFHFIYYRTINNCVSIRQCGM